MSFCFLIFGIVWRYELCFIGEKMVKATTALHGHETETEKSQTHSLHSTNGERNSTDGDNIMIDVFRWSRCKRALPQKVMRSLGIPLPLEHLEVLRLLYSILDLSRILSTQINCFVILKTFRTNFLLGKDNSFKFFIHIERGLYLLWFYFKCTWQIPLPVTIYLVPIWVGL